MRRHVFGLVALALTVCLLVPSSATAQTLSALKARLEELKAENAAAGRAYMRAYWALDETDVRLERTSKRIKKSEKNLAKARQRLNRRANSIYRREQLDILEFVVGASSFEEFVNRLEYMSRLGAADAEAVAEVKSLKARLLAQRTRLREERKRRAKDVAHLKRERTRMQNRLASKQAEFARVQGQIAARRARGRMPSGVVSMPGNNGMVFPVVGSYYYADTWGASRSGGRRRHQGTDIMARRGTPCVAISSGTVSSKSGGLGGRVIWLRGDNGWLYYYAHLDRWAVRSGRVKAGQVIGTVGSTGNASGGSPHLHLQMHPGGGGPVNPYPYLRAME